VLMPGPRRALFSCRAGGLSSPGDGRGITAELVPDTGGDGFSISVATPQAAQGEAFVAMLSSRLKRLSLDAGRQADDMVSQDLHDNSARIQKEAQAYYYCSRVLSNTQHEPGSVAAEFTKAFAEKCSQLSPTAMEQGRPMADCLLAVGNLTRLLERHLNESCRDAGAGDSASSSKAAASLVPYFRGAVERVIFARTGRELWRLYESRHSAEDAQYSQKARRLSSFSSLDLLASLGVPDIFCGVDTFSQAVGIDKSSPKTCASQRTTSTAAETDEALQAGTRSREQHSFAGDAASASCAGSCSSSAGPYSRAAAALSQIEADFNSGRASTPREVVEALLVAQLEMKTCALEASSGQAELSSMDDIMPVFIFVLARSSLRRPFACAKFMWDALTQDQRIDSEGRAVLLLESAARHVAYDWDLGPLETAEGGCEASEIEDLVGLGSDSMQPAC